LREMAKFLSFMATILIITTAFTGCLNQTDEDIIKIAYKTQDEYNDASANPQLLADFITAQSGFTVELYPISSDIAAIEALRFGHADIAFLDGGAAFIAWKQHGLDVILANQNSDGSTFYTAQAWVLKNSSIQSLEDLEGKNSCHTGWLKSAGMLMPMGYLINNGLIEVSEESDDIDSLRTIIENHFGTATIPEKGNLYYGYSGGFRCMTEGVGDVAFVKSTSYEDHCEGNDWCLDRSEYRLLSPAFGRVPSHPMMINMEIMSQEKMDVITDAFLALNSAEGGSEILEGVLNTQGISEVTTESHLASYSDSIGTIPGIANFFDEKYGS
jgi:ABC-type phosphate/phosphonate transport system substrate-binding protein